MLCVPDACRARPRIPIDDGVVVVVEVTVPAEAGPCTVRLPCYLAEWKMPARRLADGDRQRDDALSAIH